MYESILSDESQTNACSQLLANSICICKKSAKYLEFINKKEPIKIYFSGEIGAAKSFFIRYFLQTLGVTSKIKSPTFSIIESYHVNENTYVHMDLYRIEDEDELHYLGFEEYYSEASILLIEWPEKVRILPKADLFINLSSIDFGEKRKINIQSISKLGKLILNQFSSNISV